MIGVYDLDRWKLIGCHSHGRKGTRENNPCSGTGTGEN